MDSAHHMDVPNPDLTVLVVEDEPVARKALQILLSGYGYNTRSFASGEEALRFVHGKCKRIIALIDLDLPGMSGDQLLRHLRSAHPETEAVIITAASADRVRELTQGENVMHMRKPLDFNSLLHVLSEHRCSHD